MHVACTALSVEHHHDTEVDVVERECDLQKEQKRKGQERREG
jgi:hypothetical protein